MDLHTGVTALESLHRQSDARTVNRPALNRQADGSTGATGAGHGENALVLTVQIDERPTLQHRKVDAGRTKHTGLLIYGNNDLQRRMGNGLVCQQRQSISHSDAVVAAQRGALGKHVGFIVCHIQALGIHIDGAIGVLVAYHIHMALKNHRLVILVATSALAKENHIVKAILDIPQALLLGKFHQVVADLLGVAGAVGVSAQLFKITKYAGRLQSCQFYSFHNTAPLFKVLLFYHRFSPVSITKDHGISRGLSIYEFRSEPAAG